MDRTRPIKSEILPKLAAQILYFFWKQQKLKLIGRTLRHDHMDPVQQHFLDIEHLRRFFFPNKRVGGLAGGNAPEPLHGWTCNTSGRLLLSEADLCSHLNYHGRSAISPWVYAAITEKLTFSLVKVIFVAPQQDALLRWGFGNKSHTPRTFVCIVFSWPNLSSSPSLPPTPIIFIIAVISLTGSLASLWLYFLIVVGAAPHQPVARSNNSLVPCFVRISMLVMGGTLHRYSRQPPSVENIFTGIFILEYLSWNIFQVRYLLPHPCTIPGILHRCPLLFPTMTGQGYTHAIKRFKI